jgi:MarR family
MGGLRIYYTSVNHPAADLLAVLLIDEAGVLPVGRLAVALGLSASRTRSLCDLMETAGLVAYGAGSALTVAQGPTSRSPWPGKGWRAGSGTSAAQWSPKDLRR